MKNLLCLLALLCCLTACDGDQPTDATPDTSAGDPGIAALDRAILSNPEEADLYAQRAEMWYNKSNYDAAITDLQAALTLDSTNVPYHWLLSDVYLDYYRSRLALRTLERAAKLEPDNLETQLRLAETQLTLQQYDGAMKSLNEVTRIDPRNPDAYLLLSETFLETGDTARAISAAEEAAEIDPDMTDAFVRLGQLLFAIKSNRAVQYFDAAMGIDATDPIPIHAKADYLRDSDRLPEAIELYRAASRADRQYVAGHFNAGLLLMELDSVEAAKTEFDLVIKNDPIHIRSYFFRGYAKELLGDIAGARNDYKSALRFAPDYDFALEGLERVGEEPTEE
ncbi:lipopolysaccharide assembly protein LapB [Lewinella sp. 4G2]|uniref:tetratricopeptide repeat protein n=1 Tax=Lewinella sp. 4G2 TaxID=1803372 RepID=UPI0007B4EF8B|nr:tetratricopeptide repeat protein [Lewinella sp. 4G2]OAV44440.1 hypothetical protein A3850_008010 [Lewinella sp. 4G2]